jgi:hypothetical protein
MTARPPSDPRIVAFLNALSEGVAELLLRELRDGSTETTAGAAGEREGRPWNERKERDESLHPHG